LSFSIIIGFTISVVYIGLGVFILIADSFFSFSSFQRLGFGLILIIYGIFRFYRTMKKKRESRAEDYEE
jgi:hypothetical protein